MSRRQKPQVTYELNLDEYVYCEKCADLVFEYCSIHGPLLVIPDDKVIGHPDVPSYVPRAALTIPNVFLHIAPSVIPEAGLGVFASLTLPSGVRFGPYTGERTNGVDSYYSWQIYDACRKPSYCIDAADANKSNWMRYVNCARHWTEQNIVAFQYQGQLYYRTIKIIPRFKELMVFYGSEFANELDIDIGKFNSPGYLLSYCSPVIKKRKLDDDNINFTEQDVQSLICQENKICENNPKTKQSISETNQGALETKLGALETKLGASETNQGTSETNQDAPETNQGTRNALGIQNKDWYFRCNECGDKFLLKTALEKHTRFHDKNRAYTCEFCSYRFSHSTVLSRHKFLCHKISPGNKITHPCEICNKTLFHTSDLERHLRTHTGEKPYACDTCGTKFGERGYLKKHMRIHTEEKPYACDTCGAKFWEKRTLENHMRIHTGEKPYACDTCGAKFGRIDSLKKHLRTHTGEKPFACTTCERKFTDRRYLKKHLIKNHT